MPAGEDQRGQATVEFALVLPVTVMFALVIAQVGLVARDYLLVHHAAREGARAAAVAPTKDAATEGAHRASSLDTRRMTVTLAGGTEPGDHLQTTVVYESPTRVPLVGRLVGDVVVSASVTMRVE